MISEEERKKYVEFMYNPENEYIAEKLWNKYKV